MTIDPEAFGKFSKDFVEKCRNDPLVNWYHWSPTLHKVLWHGEAVIAYFDFPISWLSEEPLESNNKIFKKFRQYFARKSSRKDNLRDVFARICVSSDPLVLKWFFKLRKNNRKSHAVPDCVKKVWKQTDPDSLK